MKSEVKREEGLTCSPRRWLASPCQTCWDTSPPALVSTDSKITRNKILECLEQHLKILYVDYGMIEAVYCTECDDSWYIITHQMYCNV